MNENNELLTYIYQNAKMGVKNCTNLIQILNSKDNKIKKRIAELTGAECEEIWLVGQTYMKQML